MELYLVYLRKSRADEERERLGEGETLAIHRDRISRLCKERGYVVEEVFEELVSGEAISARTEFQRLMEKVQTRRYTGVIFHALDRIGRGDMMEYGWILSTFQYTETLIITPERTYDPNFRPDLQILQLQMFFSNDELLTIKRRLREGKLGHSAMGEHIASRAPLGYRKVVVAGKKTLEPDEWADTVRQVFEDVASGERLWTLSCRLRQQGVPGSWHNQRIKCMITNPVYKGMIGWNRRVVKVQCRDGMDFVKKEVPGDNPQIVKGLHPAIVSDELWDAANRMIGNNPRGPHGPLRNPLAGILRCSKCGRTMYFANSGKDQRHHYYRHPYNTECGCKGAPVGKVKAAVIGSLSSLCSDFEAKVRIDSRKDAIMLEKGNLEKSVKEIKRKSGKLMELYMAEAISVDEFKSMREELDAEAESCASRLDEIAHMDLPDPEDVVVRAKEAIAALEDSDDAEAVNCVLKKLVSRIDYEYGDELSLSIFLL